ncbi:hypothetical protein ACFQV4_26350 [Streptomyces thermocarboxydus]
MLVAVATVITRRSVAGSGPVTHTIYRDAARPSPPALPFTTQGPRPRRFAVRDARTAKPEGGPGRPVAR